MTDPVRAADTPFAVTLEAGKDYWWCACGKSRRQPFCDGSHRADAVFEPVKYTAAETRTIHFCGCKQSGNKPLCDGSHKRAT